ncbi:MAG: DUF4159 domain-containing protein [Alphaproteobacteria bacterium]
MLSLGPLAFAVPWMLAALVALPLLWWLLRAVPPAPRLIPFPAIRLLLGLPRTEEQPHRTPWWLVALRLLLAAFVILALARPIFGPPTLLRTSGPLVVVIDNGWSAARDWAAREAALDGLLAEAERDGRPVILLPTAPDVQGRVAAAPPAAAAEARQALRTLAPLPWPVDRAATLAAVEALGLDRAADVVWLSDGLAASDGNDVDRWLAGRLQRLGALTVVEPPATARAILLAPPTADATGLVVRAQRAASDSTASADVDARGEDGRLLARATLDFAAGGADAQIALDLPIELRNRVTSLALVDGTTAGGVFLLDEHFRRRPVGIAAGDTAEQAQPLLGDAYYLERALAPFADVRSGTVEALTQRELAVLMIADIGTLTEAQVERIGVWIEAGGVLVRFAGPRLAEGGDDLLPVRLRRGGRVFGGAMSWQQPARLAPFDPASPFAGLAVPGDVTVTEQVLAEPSPELGARTWARLTDGTPLVTAETRGKGRLVLFHTSANAAWSSLAISGLYVDMLKRLMALSQGVAGEAAAATLPPLATLDGWGRVGTPPPQARPVATADFATVMPGPRHPPGWYGSEEARQAVNLGARVAAPAALGPLPAGVSRVNYGPAPQSDLRAWLFVAALLLLLADFVIALALRGLAPARVLARAGAVALAVAGGLALPPQPAQAQSSDAFAVEVTETTRLAYVLTGDLAIDEASRAGLIGLSVALATRTSVEPGEPIAIDLRRDELAFFPLLYWPMTPSQTVPGDAARARLNEFLRHGGTILFDTRDQAGATSGSGAGTQALRRLVAGLDVPPLVPVPPDHVLTKAFYLLQEFPGRYTGGALWVQQPDMRVNDGVSPVVVSGNDFAAAWAIDGAGRPMFPVVPGGDRQREMALRFGINLVMYALTGNYKADQVHVPAILERLGQ